MRGIIQKTIFFSIIISVLYSCTSLGKIGIQISVPPKYPVSPEIQSIALLNRSLTPYFKNLDRDSLENILVNHDLDLNMTIYDSIAADTAIQVAAKALFESGRFDAVVPEERNVQKHKSGILAPLDQDFIENICKKFNTDGILVLEDFSEHITTEFSVTRFGMVYGRSLKEYDGVINIFYKTVWRLYQPKLDPPIVKYEANDTIFWEVSDYTLRDMYNKLPSVKEALIGGGIASANEIANDISPKWENDVRKYFITGNKEIDSAIPLIKENKWEEAAEIWMNYSNASSKTLKSMIEFNLAVAAEMNGDLDLAVDWATKSYKTKYSNAAVVYLKSLAERQLALKKYTTN